MNILNIFFQNLTFRYDKLLTKSYEFSMPITRLRTETFLNISTHSTK